MADLTDDTYAWFRGLEDDNSREGFARSRPVYDAAVRAPLVALLERAAAELGGGTVKVFRQQRDVRFSKDRSPYKTTAYGVVGGRPGTDAGLYAELSSGGLAAGSGFHDLAPDQLARFRAAVASDATGPALVAAVEAARGAGLGVFGEVLKTAPRGFPRDHPRVELLRHKLLVAIREREPTPLSADDAFAFCRDAWSAVGPLCAWLDEHVGPSALSPEERPRR